MDKTQDAFRTIGEVAEALDLPQHVLRFWETKFSQIRPVKRAGGRRYYRPEDVQLVAAIRVLLYSEGYTIRGVQRILKEQGARALIAASRANGRALRAGARRRSRSRRRRAANRRWRTSTRISPPPPPRSHSQARSRLKAAHLAGAPPGCPRRIVIAWKPSWPNWRRADASSTRPRRRLIRLCDGFFRRAVASFISLLYKAGSRSVAQSG